MNEFKQFIEKEFTFVNISGTTESEKVNEVNKQVDAICDRRLAEFEKLAASGNTEYIVKYNMALIKDNYVRNRLKQYFIQEIGRQEFEKV